MLFRNADHKKNALNEEIEKLRKELCWLYKELDFVKNEIADQRMWVNIIMSEKTNVEKYIEWLNVLYRHTTKMTQKSRNHFNNITDKQAENIKELNQKINSKLFELEEYWKKELIDIDFFNLKYKTEINEKISEVGKLSWQIDHMKKQMDEFEKHRTEESQKLDKISVYQEKVKTSLQVREQKLKLKEKRLNKLHLELKQLKNG